MQPVCHSGGSEKAEEPFTQVFTPSFTPITGEIWAGCLWLTGYQFLRDRTGIQRESLKCFELFSTFYGDSPKGSEVGK